MERIIYYVVIVSASFALGFLAGHTRATQKYTKKQKKLTQKVQALENFKHAVKVLCPKIRDGEEAVKDENEVVDHLSKKLKSIVLPVKEDEDTKTGELEIVTKGDPKDA